MLKLSPCLEMLWPETAFANRVPKAAALGYGAYEFWAWWGKDLGAIEKATKDTGLRVAACCVNTDFASAGLPPLLAQGNGDHLVQAVKDCLPVSERLGCKTFIVTTGNELEGVSRADQHAACVRALKAAAPVAEDEGLTLVLEPLNVLVDHAGYYLATSAQGFRMIEEVSSPAVKLLFDIYHQQITEGNLARNICDNIDKIGHFHTANNPGRHELSLGEINYSFLFDRIDQTGYDGFVGLEFSPSDASRTEGILKETLAMIG